MNQQGSAWVAFTLTFAINAPVIKRRLPAARIHAVSADVDDAGQEFLEMYQPPGGTPGGL